MYCKPSDRMAIIEAGEAQKKAEANGAPHCEAFWITYNWFMEEAQPYIPKRHIDHGCIND